MPDFYKSAQSYLKKKINHTQREGISSQQVKSPIPNLGINSIFRQRSFNGRSGFTKYLFEFDIAAHALVVLVILIAGILYVTKPAFLTEIAYLTKNQTKNSVAVMSTEQQMQSAVIKPVYASEKEMNAPKIFSVDPGNVTLVLPGTPKKTVYGFFPYWMLETESQISFDQLTAMAIFGLDVDGEGNIITQGADRSENPGWSMWNDPKLNQVLTRAKKKRLTVELAIKNFNNSNIEKLISSDEAQKRFIANVIYLVQSKSLNGINIDFEYVGNPSNNTREGFTRLIANLRSEMQRQIPGSTLTVDTYATAASVQGLFDIEQLSMHIDSFIIMGYDINTPSGPPGPIAPLEGSLGILGLTQSYLEKAPADKIILAVPYYGYDWLKDGVRENHDMLSYAEIVDQSKDKTIKWDQNAQSPFYTYLDPATQKERIVYFENVRSLGAKYDFVNNKKLRGIGIWALGYDGRNTDLRNLLVEKFAK